LKNTVTSCYTVSGVNTHASGCITGVPEGSVRHRKEAEEQTKKED